MDPVIQVTPAVSGPIVAIIGIGTVFFALTILVVSLDIVRRILERLEGGAPEAAVPAAIATLHVETTDHDSELLQVALAAYGLHQRRKVSVRPPGRASRWSLAGRSQQVLRAQQRH